MQKMTPAILTGTVFGLLQSFGLSQMTIPPLSGGPQPRKSGCSGDCGNVKQRTHW